MRIPTLQWLAAGGLTAIAMTAQAFGGACCLPDGTCTNVTSVNCAAMAGVYAGDPTTCMVVECQAIDMEFPPNAGPQFFSFDQFDTMGGTRQLQQVIYGADARLGGVATATNTGTTPYDFFNFNITGAIEIEFVDPPFGPANCDVMADEECPTLPLPPGGMCNFGFIETDSCATLQSTMTTLAPFVGAGMVDVTVTSTGFFFIVAPGNATFNLNMFRLRGEIILAYVFGEVPGACCDPCDGTCTDVTMAQCAASGGIFQGVGTTCAVTVCPAMGACCFPDNSCLLTTPVACASGGGDYLGDCTSCVPNPCLPAQGGCDSKGSLVIWSKVELRWSPTGEVLQDTFISLLNDFPEDVQVQLYFVNGDEPLEEDPGPPFERAHPGWNWVDNVITLTQNEPAYWSALTGLPKGVSPFTVLDPGIPPGRPAMDGSGDRVLRGFILGWAINSAGDEIRWNHLAGSATLVNYQLSSAWEYNACARPIIDPALANGDPTGTPGVLNVDGTEYAPLYEILIMDFYAAGSQAFSGGIPPQIIEVQTDLTLHPADADLRQETDGPVITKASFDIWNMNEVKFSGTDRCITCWDQTLLADYGIPNHFRIENLQTDKGKARIDGLMSILCPDSQAAALLGVVAKFLEFEFGLSYAASGTMLHGAGTQGAIIRYDPNTIPPELQSPDAPPVVRTAPSGARNTGL